MGKEPQHSSRSVGGGKENRKTETEEKGNGGRTKKSLGVQKGEWKTQISQDPVTDNMARTLFPNLGGGGGSGKRSGHTCGCPQVGGAGKPEKGSPGPHFNHPLHNIPEFGWEKKKKSRKKKG